MKAVLADSIAENAALTAAKGILYHIPGGTINAIIEL